MNFSLRPYWHTTFNKSPRRLSPSDSVSTCWSASFATRLNVRSVGARRQISVKLRNANRKIRSAVGRRWSFISSFFFSHVVAQKQREQKNKETIEEPKKWKEQETRTVSDTHITMKIAEPNKKKRSDESSWKEREPLSDGYVGQKKKMGTLSLS